MRRLIKANTRIFPMSLPPAHGRQNIRVFFDFAIEGQPLGRVVFQLFDNVAPRAAENFLQIAKSQSGLTYQNSKITKILPFRGLWGGVNGSIYGKYFVDENFAIKHDRAGILTTANNGVNTNDGNFIITLAPAEWLDRKSVAFGEVIYGQNYINAIERLGSSSGVPKKSVSVVKSGEVDHHEYDKYTPEVPFNVWEVHHH